MIGVRILQSELALQYHREFRVEQVVIKKRRKGYRVIKREWSTPCAYRLADGTIVLHPELYRTLKESSSPSHQPGRSP